MLKKQKQIWLLIIWSVLGKLVGTETFQYPLVDQQKDSSDNERYYKSMFALGWSKEKGR